MQARVFFAEIEGNGQLDLAGLLQTLVAAQRAEPAPVRLAAPPAPAHPAQLALPAASRKGRPPKKAARAAAASLKSDEDLALAAASYLQSAGRARSDVIIRKLFGDGAAPLDQVRMRRLLQAHDWFEKESGCWKLSAAGAARFRSEAVPELQPADG